MKFSETKYWLKRFLAILIAYIFYLFAWQSAFAADKAIAPIPLSIFEEQLKSHITINPSGPNFIGHILIGDHSEGINQSTWLYVKKALDYYKKSKPLFVILELNTPGGEVFAAQIISDALKELDTQMDIPVVAYINNWAISAGAMLAYSSRFIVVTKDGSMGGAEPVIEGTEGGMTTASEKINSVIRTDFANRARFFDRDPLIAEAMVDKDMILVIRDGHVVKLDNDSQIRTQAPNPDKLLSPKGKLLTLSAEQLTTLGVADLMVPPTKVVPLTEAEKESGKWPASKSALFHLPFFDTIPNASIDSFQMDWKTRFFAFLGSPFISSLLVLGLIIGFYLEVTTPGFGLPGTVAVLCLFLISLSSFSLEIANWLELVLLLTGVSIIIVELFVLPTFGLLGFIGIVLFLVGLFGMLIPGVGAVDFEFDTLSLNAAGQAFLERLGWLCGTLLVAVAAIVFLLRYLTPKTMGFNRFVLYGGEQTGYTSAGDLKDFPAPGKKGKAETTLRPAGKVVIHGKPYDAISRGSLIEKGDSIVVVGIDSGTLIVTKEE
ncbi:MAG: NfeD family protein [Parachlamydiaceae bacterium]